MSDRNLTGVLPNRSRKLNEQDKIHATGLPALQDDREYRVAYVDYARGIPFYAFRVNRGRRIVARYFCHQVDHLVGGRVKVL